MDNLQGSENVNLHRSIKVQLTKKPPSFGKESEILYHVHKYRYGSFYFLMIINFIPDFNYINFNQSDSSIIRVIFVYFDRWWESGTHSDSICSVLFNSNLSFNRQGKISFNEQILY